MPTIPTIDLGHGPGIVLLHGVGVGPDTFEELVTRLAGDHRVLVPERPRGGAGGATLAQQAAWAADHVRYLGTDGTMVVGVSGGATLALELAIRHPEVVGALVAHEPLLGPHVPALHERFAAAARRAARSDEEAMDVVQGVVGAVAWARLDATARARVEAGASRARAEIPMFAAFAPTEQQLAGLRAIPLLTTVGADSAPERHAAAAVLVELAGAAMAEVPGAGNAVQIDAPAEFAAILRAWRPAAMAFGA